MAVVGVSLTVTACSSSSSSHTSSTTAPTGVAVLGATSAVWRSAHPSTTVGGVAGYGSAVTVDGHSVPQFTSVKDQAGRVVAFRMSFTPATRLAVAERLIRAQLPADVEQTASWRGSYGKAAAYCEFVNFRSKELATTLQTTTASADNIGVTVYRIERGRAGSPSIRIVNTAIVSTTPSVLGQSC